MSCGGCGTQNRADALYCKGCGKRFPAFAGQAAQAAADATSSSGRRPWSASERAEYLDRKAAERASSDALPLPAPTGRGFLADLGAAEDHYTQVDAEWDRLDVALKQARSEAGMFPTAGDLAELRDLQRRVDTAWASRSAAKVHRDRLWEREHWLYEPGQGLPPGELQW